MLWLREMFTAFVDVLRSSEFELYKRFSLTHFFRANLILPPTNLNLQLHAAMDARPHLIDGKAVHASRALPLEVTSMCMHLMQ
jgi:hypothetical protein